MSLVGHNGGPTLEPGESWRRHCWAQARAELLPRLPIEVLRLRIRRAAEIGLDYKTYAGVRASSGQDIVALLFSSNALRILRDGERLAADRAGRLASLQDVGRLLSVQPPMDPQRLQASLAGQGVRFDRADRAPPVALSWGQVRASILAMLAPLRLPSDRVLLVGDTGLERGWAEAGRLAGYLPAARYFTGGGAAHG